MMGDALIVAESMDNIIFIFINGSNRMDRQGFLFFQKSPMGAYGSECWDSPSPSEKGAKGEKIALNYNKKELGYRLITKNWRHRRGEIDLICLEKECLVFIKVRLRKVISLVPGIHLISRSKNHYCDVVPWPI
tara:strand:+ start:548 stop:946 length:399 start_codon:yes stop_codon:yes gene_type:complete